MKNKCSLLSVHLKVGNVPKVGKGGRRQREINFFAMILLILYLACVHHITQFKETTKSSFLFRVITEGGSVPKVGKGGRRKVGHKFGVIFLWF